MATLDAKAEAQPLQGAMGAAMQELKAAGKRAAKAVAIAARTEAERREPPAGETEEAAPL